MQLTRSEVYSVPPWATAFGFAMVVAFFSDLTIHHFAYIVMSIAAAISGFAVMLSPLSFTIKYGALFLITSGTYTAMPLIGMLDVASNPWDAFSCCRLPFDLISLFILSSLPCSPLISPNFVLAPFLSSAPPNAFLLSIIRSLTFSRLSLLVQHESVRPPPPRGWVSMASRVWQHRRHHFDIRLPAQGFTWVSTGIFDMHCIHLPEFAELLYLFRWCRGGEPPKEHDNGGRPE